MSPDVVPWLESHLDHATTAELLAAIETRAEDLVVRTKGGAGAPGADADGRRPLAEYAADLAAGAVRGVQVMYDFDGGRWCDTFIVHEGGVRLVRMPPDRPS